LGRQAKPLIADAVASMRTLLDEELSRIIELKRYNPAVPDEEIDLLKSEKVALENHLAASRLRLDAIRVIRRGSAVPTMTKG